jgi:hypothetical protein
MYGSAHQCSYSYSDSCRQEGMANESIQSATKSIRLACECVSMFLTSLVFLRSLLFQHDIHIHI